MKNDMKDSVQRNTSASLEQRPGRHRPIVEDASEYAERIRSYRNSIGVNQRELAESIGVTASAITNWELGRTRPDLTTLRKLCIAFGISADDMLNLPSVKKTSPIIHVTHKSDYTAKQLSLLDDILALPDREQRILTGLIASMKAEYAPKLKEIRTYGSRDEFDDEWAEVFSYYASACAGDGNDIPGEDEGESIYVRQSSVPNGSDCIVPIDGDSMEPLYHSGDRVLVKRTENFNYGDIIVVFVNDMCMIKEYAKEGLRPLNDTKYGIIRITDGTCVRPFGKVVGVLSDDMLPDKDEQRSIDLFLEDHPQ